MALAGLLGRGGFDLWVDRERIAGGKPVDAEIVGALRDSAALLCLVSPSWLKKGYCLKEGEIFSNRFGSTRPIIPLLRMPRDPEEIPSYLIPLNPIVWLHREPSEELFWQLRCALLGEPPGPAADWLEQGRSALGLPPSSRRPFHRQAEAEEEARRRSRLGYGEAALLCGRDPQWNEINVHARLDHHAALFVQGARIEAPDLFLDAVGRCFLESPARQIVPVPWTGLGSAPRSEGQFRYALATALGCKEPDVKQELRYRLQDSNLVLVHKPVLQEDLEETPMRDYYCSLLPALLPAPGETRGFVKAVQGVAWAPACAVTRGLAWLALRLWPRPAIWIERALEKPRAESVLEHLEDDRSEPLRLILLKPLQPIGEDDVVRWSKFLGPGIDPAAAVRDVLRRARTSAEILARVATYSNPQED